MEIIPQIKKTKERCLLWMKAFHNLSRSDQFMEAFKWSVPGKGGVKKKLSFKVQ